MKELAPQTKRKYAAVIVEALRDLQRDLFEKPDEYYVGLCHDVLSRLIRNSVGWRQSSRAKLYHYWRESRRDPFLLWPFASGSVNYPVLDETDKRLERDKDDSFTKMFPREELAHYQYDGNAGNRYNPQTLYGMRRLHLLHYCIDYYTKVADGRL